MKFTFEERSSDSPFIQTIWRTRSEEASRFTSLAASNWEMVVTKYQGKTTLTVRGPETKARPADCPPEAEFFGMIFRIGTFMPPLPLKHFVDNETHLPETASQRFWLHGSAWEFPTFDNADTFLDRLKRQGLLAHEPIVEAALQDRPQFWSTRSVQRRFLQATGLTLNSIRQIERARQAMTLLEQGMTIADVVHQMGYFDQPHLTRSLKQLVGQTPAQIIKQNQAR